MKIPGCVLNVLMRRMDAWSLETLLGKAGTAWHVDVVRCAIFQSRNVGCAQML